METFNILGKSITFNEDFSKYLNINAHKQKLCNEYTTKYHAMNTYVNNLEELYEYINNLSELMKNTFTNSADEVLNLLTNYQIFDKSLSEILSNCKWANSYFKNIEEVSQGIQEFLKKQEKDIQETALEAADSVEYNQLNVWSSSGWDLFVADLINIGEERKAEKKQERIYKYAVNKQVKAYTKLNNEYANSQQQTLQEKAFIFGISSINEMFDYCINILISNGKLSLDIKEHLQKEKADNILSNIPRIQDENIKQEQLIIAFEADPFSSEIHSKIMDYIKNDIEEYIRLVKFIKCEDIILEICQNKCANFNNENDKYVKIINLLDEKYIKNIILKANTIEDIENSNPNINLSISKKLFYMEFNKVFDAFLYAGNIIGKIQEQDKINGHILVKCSMSLKNMLNPTTIDIKIRKQNANETIVEISSLCKNDGAGVLQSPQKWKMKLLEEVYKKLDSNIENSNKIVSNNINKSLENNIENVNKVVSNDIKNINVTEDNNVKDIPKTQIPKSIYKFEDTEKIVFDKDYKYVFDVFIYASYFVGKTLKQDRINGHIIINRSLSIWQMTPPTIIDIKINKIDESKTEVNISTLSKNAQILGTPLVWKNKLLQEVYKNIGNQDEKNINKDKSEECYSTPKELAKMRKSKAKKATIKIYIIFIILLTLFNILCELELAAIITCDITLSIIFYPIIYICTRLYYRNK